MHPRLVTGDLVVLEGVSPARLRKGDIIAVTVAPAFRKRYDLPAHVVHRIVGIDRTKHGLVFTTKGDANHSDDIFKTPASNIVGEVAYTIPKVGYAFLFFGSRQGEIFLGSAGGILLLYFLLGLWEDRRAYLAGVSSTMEALRQESDDLRRALEHSSAGALAAGDPAQMPRQTATILERVPTFRSHASARSLDELAREVRSASERSEESVALVRDLVGAVNDYGLHLRSHTAVMQHLARTTDKLEQAAGMLITAVTKPEAAGRAELPTLGASQAIRRDEPFDPACLRSPDLEPIAGGYLAAPVERLLGRAADALDAMARDNDDLRERLVRLEAQLRRRAQSQRAQSQELQQESFPDTAAGAYPRHRPSPQVPPVWEVLPPPGG